MEWLKWVNLCIALFTICIIAYTFREEIKVNKKQLGVVICIGLLLSTSGILGFANKTHAERTAQQTVEMNKKVTSAKKGSEEFSKQGAVNGVNELMKEIDKVPDGKKVGVEKRLAQLDTKDVNLDKYITKEARDRLYISDIVSNNAERMTVQSLIATRHMLGEMGYVGKPTASDKEIDATVYIDKDHKLAIVPLSVFTGKDTPLSLEMFYDNGTWRVMPYSFLQTVQLLSSVEIPQQK